MFLVTDLASVCGYRSGWCFWLQIWLVVLVTDQAGVSGYRSGETASSTVVFVTTYYFTMTGVSGYRSGWCFWLQIRLVFVVTDQAGVSGYRQAGVCGYRSGWCFWL